jgi:sulfite exporter TauE/SafE
MDFALHAFAACRDGLAGVVMAPAALPASLFLAGLGGSALHCAGMCGPFVLGQVMADAQGIGRSASYGEWRRLAGAALGPYHLGRLTTYVALGGVAGAAMSIIPAGESLGWLSASMLVLGAGLMLTQAAGLAFGTAAPQAPFVRRLAAPFTASRRPSARFALGLALGLLPCGLIYAALSAAAGTGSALQGALAMASFGLGTTPALIAVGWGGLMLRRRLGSTVRWVAAPLLLITSMLMLALAAQRL